MCLDPIIKVEGEDNNNNNNNNIKLVFLKELCWGAWAWANVPAQ